MSAAGAGSPSSFQKVKDLEEELAETVKELCNTKWKAVEQQQELDEARHELAEWKSGKRQCDTSGSVNANGPAPPATSSGVSIATAVATATSPLADIGRYDLEKKLNAMTQERDTLILQLKQQALSVAQAENTQAKLARGRDDELEDITRQLVETKMALADEESRLQEARHQAREQDAIISELTRQLIAAKEPGADAIVPEATIDELVDLKTSFAEQSFELETTKHDYEALIKTRDGLQRQLEAAQTELSAMAARLAEERVEGASMQTEDEYLRKQNVILERRLGDTERELEGLKELYDALRDEVEELREKNAELEDSVKPEEIVVPVPQLVETTKKEGWWARWKRRRREKKVAKRNRQQARSSAAVTLSDNDRPPPLGVMPRPHPAAD